jgi:hypothetical protein
VSDTASPAEWVIVLVVLGGLTLLAIREAWR